MYSFVIILSCHSHKNLEEVWERDTSNKHIDTYPLEVIDSANCSDTRKYDVVRDVFHRRNVIVEHRTGKGLVLM